MNKKTLIIANNYDQYRRICREKCLHPQRDAEYISDYHKLLGYENVTIIVAPLDWSSHQTSKVHDVMECVERLEKSGKCTVTLYTKDANRHRQSDEQKFLEHVKRNRGIGFGRMMQIISFVWHEIDSIGAKSPDCDCYGSLSKEDREHNEKIKEQDPLDYRQQLYLDINSSKED
ncbi:MAG: hypothetical protein KAS32_13490 [Candidatus Peribacteraceae bacterium]|nr:hypothetical protein [Candidatus Peribacteraceae bacterium]